VVRYAWWNYADIHDCDKFPAIAVQNPGKPKPFLKGRPPGIPMPAAYDKPAGVSLDSFLDSLQTVAFIVVRNDSLICERYYGGYTRESVLPSFSVAKSFVSALVGIAIGEGKIRSVNQPVSDFLPGLPDSGFSKVTLKDLLEMRSGIRFKEEYGSPFAEMSKFYYGLNLAKYTRNLKTADEPGKAYNYQSANTELLALVLEQATGMSLPDYFAEKIWRPMGSEYPATWSTDSKKHMQAKAFCCINARAVDFAKFGQLYLDRGMSGGDTVVPAAWIGETLAVVNDSKDSQGYSYTYHWRVTPEGDFFAKGILGQYIYVCPAKKAVIVRFGKKSGDFAWAGFFRELAAGL
jgi:CubicO group peptidase (beta-lactamase class C family)